MHEKGQIFTVDMIFALSVFLFVLASSIIFSSELANNAELTTLNASKKASASFAVNTLAHSPGDPSDWQNASLGSVRALGLASERNVIDANKLARLESLTGSDYETVQALLGIARYDFEIIIEQVSTGNVLSQFGNPPDANVSTTVMDRIAVLNGNEVIMRLKLYERGE